MSQVDLFCCAADFVKTCFLSQPDFAQCNRETVQLIFSSLKDGYPDIGLVPLDPLNVTVIRLLQGNGPVSINATLNNVRIYGFSKTIVKSNKVYPQRGYSFVTRLRIPSMRIEGDYNLRGRILLLPLIGRGDCWFEPRNMDAEVTHEVRVIQKDGYNFFNLTNLHIKYDIEGLKLRLNNLFNGAKQLEESTNTYLNANWRAASESLKGILSRTIADILIGILRKIFDNIPANYFIGDVEYQGN
ncbi:UNVERIFIED_CONTAM: hypothetical protein PYX00_002472 [Menopon gallinae]|uniref:Protein takeout n=1 Tax=Menopon gallinae TaxID=328185 RepID=A0AAW2IJ00_9NEOP